MNITLIGMPGAGKSTVGVVLAKRMGMDFIDTDLIIQKEYNKTLSEIINEKGIEEFKKVENDVISKLELDNTIIATGGSAVYGKEAMKHLRDISKVVYIELTEENIEDRLGDLNERGVVLEDGETLQELYDERIPLYKKYAHIIVNADDMVLREVVKNIEKVMLD
ncbi:MAG: shikimate kinase [Lachnospiraceae bacterium]|nr:shikimate kinase [Lachnospiraceae bacterium]MBQ5476041.1 shikimate kinase [Lachnospiraceae bacterium]